MGWFKEKKDDGKVGVSGNDIHVNPFPLSDQHINRVVQRIDRLKVVMNKEKNKEGERYKNFLFEKARLEAALLEYQHKKERNK